MGFSGTDVLGNGIPNGFNEVAFKIHTGGLQEGETLCLDSSYIKSIFIKPLQLS